MRFIYRLKQTILACGDLVGYFLALWLALAIRTLEITTPAKIVENTLIFAPLYGLWLIINFISGLYDLGKLKMANYKQFLQASSLAIIIGITFFYIFPSSTSISPKTILILTAILGYGLSFVWHWFYKKYLDEKTLAHKIIFVGLTNEALELINILNNNSGLGYKIMAIIDPENNLKPLEININLHQNLNEISSLATKYQADWLVIAPQLKEEPQTSRELYGLMFKDIRITELNSFYEVITGRVPPVAFSESWFLDHLKNHHQPIYEKIRFIFDFIIALIMGLILIILLPFIALAIKLNSPGPIFYKQKRVGKFDQEFYLYKFRSMQALASDGGAETDGAVFAQKDDRRITTIGKIMRKLRLDELPQVINLIKGNLALIGPRPERPEIVKQLKKQMPYYSLRHIIKPGLTGWAAVHQHYTDNIETSLQKLEYDLFYIKNRSIFLDLSILLRTVNVVLRMMGQ